MRYLIAYDICSPRRLHRVARYLERRGLRCQKSVFLVETTEAELLGWLKELRGLISDKEDCIQAWRLVAGEPRGGLSCGSPTPLTPPCVILSGGKMTVIDRSKPGAGRRPVARGGSSGQAAVGGDPEGA